MQINCNQISLALGYTPIGENTKFQQVLIIEIFHPHMYIKDNKISMSLQIKSNIIEHSSFYKITFIDKVKMSLKNQSKSGLIIDINNLRLNIFPETIRSLKSLYEIYEYE